MLELCCSTNDDDDVIKIFAYFMYVPASIHYFNNHTLPLKTSYLYMWQALLCPLRLVHVSAALREELIAILMSSSEVNPTLARTSSVQGLNTSNSDDDVSLKFPSINGPNFLSFNHA